MKPFDVSDTQQYPAPLRLPAPDELTTLRRQLATAMKVGETIRNLRARERTVALQINSRLQARIAELEDQLAKVRITAGFERVTVAVSGRSYAEVASGLSEAVVEVEEMSK